MRVLQIGVAYVGAQKIIEGAIHRHLKECGDESRILFAIGEADDSDAVRYETRVDNLLRRGLTKLFGKDYRFAFLSTSHLIRKIEEFAPDIVHLHTVHHGYVDFDRLMKYLAKKQIPVVHTMHDMWAFTGGCYYYTDIACDGYRHGCKNCPKKVGLDCRQNKTAKYFEKKKMLFQKLKKVSFVAVSQWVHDEAMQSAVKEYPQYTVWNGVEIPVVEGSCRDSEKFRIIGVAGTWTERKGIDRFVELAKKLGDDFEIVLVGSVSQDIEKTAPSNITFVGKVTDRQVLNNLYASADVHVSMSLEETFGMTFVEAACCGVKSVGFDSTAISQVIEKVKGYLVEAGAVSEMEMLLRKLKQNAAQCRLTQQEQSEIVQAFSPKTMAEEYVQIYKKQF